MAGIPLNESGFGHLLSYVNNLTDGWFGIVILLVWFIVCFSSLSVWTEIKNSLSASLFLTTIIATFFFYMSIIPQIVLVACIILTALSGILMLKSPF